MVFLDRCGMNFPFLSLPLQAPFSVATVRRAWSPYSISQYPFCPRFWDITELSETKANTVSVESSGSGTELPGFKSRLPQVIH